MRLTKAEQRVAVAKDALQQLRLAKYIAETGTYVGEKFKLTIVDEPSFRFNDDDCIVGGSNWDDQAKPLLRSSSEPCAVCAKGALFLSTIRKFNKATVGDIVSENFTDTYKLFGKANMDLAEIAFERWSCYGTDGKKGKARDFGYQYTHDHDRLVAILKNIIKNNGTFKP